MLILLGDNNIFERLEKLRLKLREAYAGGTRD